MPKQRRLKCIRAAVPDQPQHVAASLRKLPWLRDSWQKKHRPALEQNLEQLAERMAGKAGDVLVGLVDEACVALGELPAEIEDARMKLHAKSGKVRR